MLLLEMVHGNLKGGNMEGRPWPNEEPDWLFDEEAWERRHSIPEKVPDYDPDDPEPIDWGE